MNMQKLILILPALLFLFFQGTAVAQDNEPEMVDMNRTCFQCHGNSHYGVYIEMTDTRERRIMNPYYIVDSIGYMEGVHGTFACIHCHNYEYETYPHKASLKLEPQYKCMDCHGGDDLFAEFHFDEISEQVNESVHVKAIGDNFTCAKCHDPHTYKLIARDSTSMIKEIVAGNNAMCLDCHGDLTRYQLFTEQEQPQIMETHDWLPNQELHFKNVRCIECHTSVQDTMNVSHKILAKEKAVKKCVECHSTNSLLSNKLYKYKRTSDRSSGFYNDVILNEAYVVGANRNKHLNNISLLIFALTFGGILVHIIMRIVKR
ncbi:cytochrome c nitrite reductase pentaheme subunit [Salinivirga cyanobacteriivorans]|uniref:Cytochrome c nitrite reductase pentaheme subunit n=2 Tax=Salinivirga cyanobacteriivorans TaxID=1307839 RepID=A0A0S2HY88_9BACT|nr:cytochrome c nitrite reductase pentaheme subunit [Salinivirga cyanobacteriivorans]